MLRYVPIMEPAVRNMLEEGSISWNKAKEICRAVRKRSGHAHDLIIFEVIAETETLVLAFTKKLLVGFQRPHVTEPVDGLAHVVLRTIELRHFDDQPKGRFVIRNVYFTTVRRQHVVPEPPVIERIQHKLLLAVVIAR